MREDLPLLYPGTYYTHEPPPPWGGQRRPTLRNVRDGLARRIRAAVRPGEGPVGLVGRALASNRLLRERAFGDRGIYELIPRRRLAGRLLDVGCGTGAHMLLLADLGWEVEGIEWDACAAEVARQATGRPVTVGDVHGFESSAQMDAILLNHVFEHLPDPVADLRRMRELLRPGGRVILVWPNSHGLGARRFGEWEPPGSGPCPGGAWDGKPHPSLRTRVSFVAVDRWLRTNPTSACWIGFSGGSSLCSSCSIPRRVRNWCSSASATGCAPRPPLCPAGCSAYTLHEDTWYRRGTPPPREANK